MYNVPIQPTAVNVQLRVILLLKEPLLTATTEHHSQPSHPVACVQVTHSSTAT